MKYYSSSKAYWLGGWVVQKQIKIISLTKITIHKSCLCEGRTPLSTPGPGAFSPAKQDATFSRKFPNLPIDTKFDAQMVLTSGSLLAKNCSNSRAIVSKFESKTPSNVNIQKQYNRVNKHENMMQELQLTRNYWSSSHVFTSPVTS